MTNKRIPFVLSGDTYTICSWCPESEDVTKVLEAQEARKVELYKGHYKKKLISHGICASCKEEMMQQHKKETAPIEEQVVDHVVVQEPLRPRGVEPQTPMSDEELQGILDECNAKLDFFKTKKL